jgi:hypothetical protein
MSRTTRYALAFGALSLVVAGSVLASPAPRDTPSELLAASQQPEAPPTGEDLAHARDRLAANGISVTRETLETLAADYGLGGAVRLVAWADQTGRSVGDLRAMRDAGAGWGQLAHDLGVHPGLGTIMGNGGGGGRADAPGQE